MESLGENRDEQRSDAILQLGDNESLRSRDAERVADGASRVVRPNSGQGAEVGILGVDGAGVGSGKNAARDAGTGGFLSLNGIGDGEERVLHLGNRDVQLTMRLGDALEDDARAVARSLTTLLASLKSALSEVTGSSVDHMRTENEAAGQVQDAAIDAATKGNRFINACLRLNEEMKGMTSVNAQLELLKQKVDLFEHQSNKYLPRH